MQYKLPRKTYLFVNGINVVITPYYARKTRIKCYNLRSSSKIVFIMNPKNPHPPDVTPVMIHSSKITPEVYPGITPFKISPRYIPVYYVLPKYHRSVFSFYIFLCQRRGKVSDSGFEDISPGLASQTRDVNGLWNLHKPLRKTARARVVEGYMRPEICLF